MSEIKIDLLSDGIRALLKSEEVSSFVRETAEGVRGKCAGDYEADTFMTPSRAVSSVYTASQKAMQDNLENNTLLRALG